MPFEAAKCPSCGAAIQVPSETEETFCGYCGNRIITKAAISYYQVEISGSVSVKNQTSIEKQATIIRNLLDEYNRNIAHIPQDKVEQCLETMQGLDPTSVDFLLYDCLFSLHGHPTYSLGGYALFLWMPSFRETVVHKKMGWFSPYYAADRVVTYEPRDYSAWKKERGNENGVCGCDDRAKRALMKMDRLLGAGDQGSILRFADLFMQMISNQRFEAPGIVHSISNGIYTTQERFAFKITYNNLHRARPEMCIADNVIEFTIPCLKDELRSQNKELMFDALVNECRKYPHSDNVMQKISR